MQYKLTSAELDIVMGLSRKLDISFSEVMNLLIIEGGKACQSQKK